MVTRAETPRLGGFHRYGAALAAGLLLGLPAAGQTVLTLDQASSRRGADRTPAFAGEVVLVRGIAASLPVGLLYYDHLSIQDESGKGLVLESTPGRLASVHPGDTVEARGTLTNRAGLPVVTLSDIKVTGHGNPPVPKRVNPAELNSFRYLGSVVSTDGKVVGKGDNTGGEYLFIGDRKRPLKVFLPKKGRGAGAGMSRFENGDRVRVIGISSQYCPSPPYDAYFQLLVADPADIVLVIKRWPVSPEFFFSALVALLSVLAAWWVRERRLAAQRATAMALASLGEDLIGAESAEEALDRIAKVLPGALKISHVRLYLYDRASRALNPVAAGERLAPVPLDPPEGELPAPAAACFRNRALLAIPRVRRSPFHTRRKQVLRTAPRPWWVRQTAAYVQAFARRGSGEPARPRSLLLLPMCAQAELLGVLEIAEARRIRRFTPDEQVAAQHLANQVAISIKLMEQESIRQRLYRSEKLAAAGQLITRVAGEVRTPLERILEIAEDSAGPAARLRSVHQEAQRAADILDRVVAFARYEPAEDKRIDLNALLRRLAEFRQLQWEMRAIGFEDRMAAEPVWILADPGQVERAFLDLLLDAERAIAGAPGVRIAIATGARDSQAIVEVTCTSSATVRGPQNLGGEWMFREVIGSCGGELRVLPAGETGFRIEVQLPLAAETAEQPQPAEWALTVLLVDSDEAARRELLDLLTARGCRVIPVKAAEPAIEMAARLRFDAIFCSLRLPGLSWVEFLERVRGNTGPFVLVSEGFAGEAAAAGDGEVFQLPKPVRAADLDQVLARIDARQPFPEHSSAQ